jgi:RNA polymerase sigma-70 factor, ECF subfamily
MEKKTKMEKNQSESELVRLIRAGQVDLFGELVERHQVKVYRLCLAFLHDPDEAEEAAQEVFVKAYRALDRFEGGSLFLTWVTRIGINHCKDMLRRRKIRRFISLDIFTSGAVPHPPQLVQEPSENRDGRMKQARIILESLPDAERTVLVLAEIEELSYEDIGRTLGISLDAVKGRLKRARERLRHFREGKGVQSDEERKAIS